MRIRSLLGSLALRAPSLLGSTPTAQKALPVLAAVHVQQPFSLLSVTVSDIDAKANLKLLPLVAAAGLFGMLYDEPMPADSAPMD